jgi:hypothetical protein
MDIDGERVEMTTMVRGASSCLRSSVPPPDAAGTAAVPAFTPDAAGTAAVPAV